MTDLQRVHQKIFGETAADTEPKRIAQFGSVIAGNPNLTGDIAVIQALSNWEQGWVGATITDRRYPTSEETTGVNKVITQQLAYLFQKGIPEWCADVDYYTDKSFCQYGGKIYQALTDNINHRPDQYSTDWKEYSSGGGGTTTSRIGDPIITLNSSLPDNCIWLEGATISRTTYANLFAIYGTSYGAGDGSTTFVLPDFRNHAIWGADSFGYIGAGLPNITGSFTGGTDYGNGGQHSGAFSIYGFTDNVDPGDGRAHVNCNYNFYASGSNAIYGASSTVQPPAIKVRVYTRYQ